MAVVDIQVPDIGDFDEVTVIELLVKPGDTVKAEQSLITVESDKASMEIPSSHAGVVKELRVKLDDKVKQGSVVLTLEVAGAAAAAHRPLRRRNRSRCAGGQPAASRTGTRTRRRTCRLWTRSKSACPTSATSRTCPSLKSWSSPATPSRPSNR